MPPTPLVLASALRRPRAASSGMHGGASSLLRLSRSGETRLPSSAALSGWAERAAAMLDLTPMMVGPQAQAGLPRPSAAQGRTSSLQVHGGRA